jgi:two-component system, LytTR family, response regulator
MRVLVVDDEAPARRKLVRMLAAAPDVEVAGEAKDGVAAVEAIRKLSPALVFLDIRMPGLDGFGVVEQVGPEKMPPVVFVTAYDEYALKAFEVQALDYLLKPVSPRRFEAVLARAREWTRRKRPEDLATRLESLLDQMGRPHFLERILVEKGGRGVLLALDEVDRVEADRNYVKLHARGTTFPLRHTMGALWARLDPARFLRLSRSEIVRLDAVREFQDWFHGDQKVLLKDGTELLWSRRFRRQARPAFTLD